MQNQKTEHTQNAIYLGGFDYKSKDGTTARAERFLTWKDEDENGYNYPEIAIIFDSEPCKAYIDKLCSVYVRYTKAGEVFRKIFCGYDEIAPKQSL